MSIGHSTYRWFAQQVKITRALRIKSSAKGRIEMSVSTNTVLPLFQDGVLLEYIPIQLLILFRNSKLRMYFYSDY